MSNNNTVLLELDLVGNNVSNFIQDEPHTLSNKQVRSIAPKLGAFYAYSVIVRDGATILARGVDYQIVELHQEATLRTGKEISSVILVINFSVSSNVTVSYQALGGHYTRSDAAIANLYQSVITDNRSVNWTNIFNKPTEFTPAIHRHLLDDVYGFEPIVDYLERIKKAITLGQTSIVLEIVNSLLSRFKRTELLNCLPSNKLIQYDALLYFLSKRKVLSQVSVDVTSEPWIKGNTCFIEVDTRNYPIGKTLYWEFYKQGQQVTLFTVKSGSFVTNNDIITIPIYVPSDSLITEFPLYVGIKENEIDEIYIATTYLIDIAESNPATSNYGYNFNSGQEDSDGDWRLTEISNNDELRIHNTLTSY